MTIVNPAGATTPIPVSSTPTSAASPQVPSAGGTQSTTAGEAIAASGGADSYHISETGKQAQQLFDAVQQSSGQDQLAVATLAQKIADGLFRPPPEAIAQALVKFEKQFFAGSA